jgi:hypothetical protein
MAINTRTINYRACNAVFPIVAHGQALFTCPCLSSGSFMSYAQLKPGKAEIQQLDFYLYATPLYFVMLEI